MIRGSYEEKKSFIRPSNPPPQPLTTRMHKQAHSAETLQTYKFVRTGAICDRSTLLMVDLLNFILLYMCIIINNRSRAIQIKRNLKILDSIRVVDIPLYIIILHT